MFYSNSFLHFFPLFHAADEFNVLKQWKAKDKDALKNLLEFLKRICKEKELAHIVLASSDYFMVSWLRQSKFFFCNSKTFPFDAFITFIKFIKYPPSNCRGL